MEAAARIARHVPPPTLEDVAVLPGASADDYHLRRGVPLVGRGCSGAILGSQPEQALMSKERRRQGRC